MTTITVAAVGGLDMALSVPSVAINPASVCSAERARACTIRPSARLSLSSDCSTGRRAIQNLSWTGTVFGFLEAVSQEYEGGEGVAAGLGLGVATGAPLHSVVERCAASANLNNYEGGPGCSFVQSPRKSSSVRLGRASRSGPLSPASSLWRGGKKRLVSVRMSVDVDDSASADSSEAKAEELIKEATEELQKDIDPRRGLEETYLVVNQGKHECRSCGYEYITEKGDPNYPIAGGIAFSDLPSDWRCPTCGAAQSYFQSKGVEVAGFAQNQNYGLGGNSMTEGQKSLLIYGSLLFFFALFLSGYFLQ